jgi:tyrosine-protein kinase Etk/Wzc
MSSQELFPLSSERAYGKDFKEILTKYLQYWYLFVIGGFLGLTAAFLYIHYYTVPKYSISSTLLIKDDETGSDLPGGLSDVSMLNYSKNIDNEIEVLSSKSLMQRVVSELGLYTSYYVEGRVRDKEIYGEDLPLKVIISSFDSTAFGKSIFIHIKPNNSFALEEDTGLLTNHKFGQQINKPYGAFTVVAASGVASAGEKVIVQFNDIRGVAKHYNQALQVEPNKNNSSVLWVGLIDPIPQRGKDIINKLIEVYNKEAIEDKNLIAANTIAFLDERLKFLTTELSVVEKDVEHYKRQNELTDINSQASNFLAQASNYNQKLSDWSIQIEVLESIEKYMNMDSNKYKMVPSTLNIQDPTLSGLIAKFNELQLERERILRTTFPNNPIVVNINEQLENLRLNIKENLRNIKRGLIITSNNLKASSEQFQTKIKNVPSMERELLEINRQQAIKQNLYLYLLQKREEAAVSLAANIANSRIIDPAMSSDGPISPNKQMICLMYLLTGLGLPFAGIFIKDLLNNKIQTQQDVEQLTDTPIIGVLVHNKYDTLVVRKGNLSPLAEMFRLIRTKIKFAAVDKENKVILVTSSMSGEGKTFFSINLGASLALTGKKVLLLELDLRNPNLLNELGMPEGLGITNYLISDRVAISDLIVPFETIDNLYVVSSGPVPPDPAELMLSLKLTHLVNELRESFDHIIIDTPPIGQVTDAFCLSSLIDSTVYIVRYGYTYKKQLNIIENIYKNKELRHPMIVLNDAKKGNRDYFGYGYNIGYGQKGNNRKKIAFNKA